MKIASNIKTKVEKKRICCNSKCGWKGKEKYTVHPKHRMTDRLCPVCYEVTEEI